MDSTKVLLIWCRSNSNLHQVFVLTNPCQLNGWLGQKEDIMKKIILVALILLIAAIAEAQIGKSIIKRSKEKIESKSGEKSDKKTVDTKEETKTMEDQSGNENKSNEGVPKKDTAQPASIKAYSKYDFVPGEKVIAFEDFSTGNVGDFPAGWNTNGSGEIVTVEGKPGRFLAFTKPGEFLPEFTNKYPEEFTFEFDLLHGMPFDGGSLHFVICQLEDFDNLVSFHTAPNVVKFEFYTAASGQAEGSSKTEIRKNSTSQSANSFDTELLTDKFNPVHISIWRQKERVRMYINQEKIWDIPKAIATDAKINALLFPLLAVEDNVKYFVSNLRLAIGAPDTRNKFITQGKWVTHGILFDVNSAHVKAESYGSLKEIASVLKENATVKVKIIGHTDSDGNDAANLDLSKRRAASVKTILAKEFGIDESRMETDGKGESEPMDKNDTPAGKANNRRVEFIKL
jgi:OmpA-OmpF porin, OOP family